MKNEITIPEHFPELNEEKFQAQVKRRDNYSLSRDLLAKENNEAIIRRLAKDKENMSENSKQPEAENPPETSQ
jgi:hypothetical protein